MTSRVPTPIRSIHRLWSVAVAWLSLVASVSTASATCLELAASGGGDDDGIGGMGLHGEDDDGIGGMGIYGTITGFGSICLNGLEVELPEDLEVASPFGPRDIDALRIGHVVSIDAHRKGESWVAESIELRPSFAGPIEAPVAGANSASILGVEIDRDAVVGLASMPDAANATGSVFAAVYGVRGASGLSRISLIEIEPQLEAAIVWGAPVASSASGAPMRIGEIEIQTQGRSIDFPDARVEVEGSWNASERRVDIARWSKLDALLPDRPRQSVELIAGTTDAGRVFFLDGRPVVLTGHGAAHDRLEAATDVEDGQSVFVTGERESDGALRVDSVTRPDSSAREGSPPAAAGHPGRRHRGDGASPGQSVSAPGRTGELPAAASTPASDHATPGAGLGMGVVGRSVVGLERGGSVQRPERPPHPARVERPPRPERPNAMGSAARPTRPNKPERPDTTRRPDRPEPPARSDRPD